MSTTIQHPLHLGYEGEKVKNLQEVLLRFIQDGTLTLTDGTDLNGFRSEMTDNFFGSHTADVVRDFRTLKGITTPETILVDETTANEINSTYQTNLDAEDRFVAGRILNSNNKPLAGLSITVFDADLRSRQTLGTTTSDANGYFELSYDKVDYDSIENKTADIQLDVTLSSGAIVTSQTYYNSDRQSIEFTIEDEESDAFISEFEELATKITALLDEGITLDDLTLDDVDHLTNELRENTNLIESFIYAHIHKVTTSIQADVFYGLFRQLLPKELEALLNQGGPSLKSALQISVATNIIDHYTETEIDVFIQSLLNAFSTLIIDTKDLTAADSRTYRILSISMTDAMITDFINHYKANQHQEGFWDELSSNITGMTSVIEEKLKHSLTLAMLTGNNPAMVKELIDQELSTTSYSVETTSYTAFDAEENTYTSVDNVNYTRTSDGLEYTLDRGVLTPVEGEGNVTVSSTSESIINYTSTDDIVYAEVETGDLFTRDGQNLISANEVTIPITSESSETTTTTEIVNPSTYVAQTGAQWEVIINSAKTSFVVDFIYPDYVEGATDAEKVTNYAEVVRSLFDKSFPQHTISAHINNDTETPYTAYKTSMDAFLVDNPDFDIRLTPAINMKKETHDFDLSNVMDEEVFVDELIGLQRMAKLTNDYAVMKALKADGNDSASAISAMSKEDFIDAYGSNFTIEGGADLAYTTADKISALSRVLAGNLIGVMQDAPDVIFASNNHSSIIEAIPELEVIFGNMDYCSCKHCRSVYSPSAYLVDALELLRKYYPRAKNELVDNRRTDIKDVKLSCVNTNTPLPYIDIVNEILEDVIATSGTSYTLTARDTTLNAKQLRSFPEYINTGSTNSDPYPVLRDTVYPWSVPYNYYQAQQNAYLDIADVKASKVAQVFSEHDRTAAFDNLDQACIYLGISPELRDIVKDISSTYSTLKKYWGVFSTGPNVDKIVDPDKSGGIQFITTSTDAQLLDAVKQVHVFLQQSKLDFNDLLRLLDCYFINPITQTTPSIDRELKILHNTSLTPVPSPTTCNPKELVIDGLTVAHLSKIHRFVRLANVLGWSFYDLDKALESLRRSASITDIDDSAIKMIAQMKEVTMRLNTQLDDVLALWDTTVQVDPYSEYGGDDPVSIPTQYERLFRDKTVIDLTGSPFDPDPGTLTGGAPFTSSDVDYLVAGLSIDKEELNALVEDYANNLGSFVTPGLSSGNTILDVDFSLVNVTRIYKEFALAQLMGMSIKNWIECRKWLAAGSMGINPFASPLNTLEFIDNYKVIKNAGLSIDELKYIYQDVVINPEEQTKNERSLIEVINDIRTKWAEINEYFTENDTEGELLQKRLEDILPVEQVQSIISILKTDTATSPYRYTQVDYDNFNNAIIPPVGTTGLELVLPASIVQQKVVGDIGSLTTVSPEVELNSHASTIEDIQARFHYFYTIASHTILKKQIREYLAERFELAPSSVEELMSNLIETATSKKGFETLLDDVFLQENLINIDNYVNLPTALDSAEEEEAYTVIARLQKVAMLANTYNLNAEDLSFLSNSLSTDMGIMDMHNMPINLTTSAIQGVPENEWLRFTQWMFVRAEFDNTDVTLFEMLQEPTTSTNLKEEWIDNMKQAFPSLTDSDITVLFGSPATDPAAQSYATPAFILNLDFQAVNLGGSKFNPVAYQKIFDCLELRSALETTMETCVFVAGDLLVNTINTMTQSNADAIIQLMKARYDDQAWLEVLKPVSDTLRIQRRDAMVAYILGSAPSDFQGVWRTDLDLFEHLLIDVEMDPCMLTSRIKQAISSTQLFIDRCTLKLEEDASGVLLLTPEIVRQWNLWRKFYRVWEANRKVFLYPENWIEPELRDDKSPFFVELEKFLKQNEVTQENVEQAYTTYLERLDEVAHMDPVGIHTDYKTGVTHAFARTKSHPHIYYYRKRAEREWTPWEKMEVQIDGSHFIPVIFRGRVRLYWLVFSPDTKQSSPITEEVGAASTRWKIELAWTELRDGKWQAKQIGKEALYTSYITEQNHTLESFEKRLYSGSTEVVDLDISFPGDLEALKNEGIIFYCNRDANGNLRFVIGEHNRNAHGVYGVGGGFIEGMKNLKFADKSNYAAGTFERIFLKHMEEYRITRPLPTYVWSVGVFHEKYNGIVAEQHGAWHGLENSYYKDLRSIEYQDWNTRYQYDLGANAGYTHDPDANKLKLLDTAPDYEQRDPNEHNKFVVLDREVPENQANQAGKVHVHKFFYQDYRNCFFVEKQRDPVAFSSTSLAKPYANAGLSISVGNGLNANNVAVYSGPLTNFSTGGHVGIGNIRVEPAIPKDEYRFFPFYHYNVNEMSDTLSKEGLDGLFDFAFTNGMFTSGDSIAFKNEYDPTAYVNTAYPKSTLDFTYEGAYSIYNWELFFHIPLLVANRLMQNQQFMEARNWFHYIFDPTSGRTGGSERFWNFIPFEIEASNLNTNANAITIVQNATANTSAVSKWAANPFNPHLVARMRISAYMKNVVMKYLDNLIAWGDQLFRRDTMESINEASLMYVLAAQILGRRPYKVPARASVSPKTYTQFIAAGTNAFSNAAFNIENLLLPTGVDGSAVISSLGLNATKMDYFCIPPNEKLLSYWDVIADRLFKIRHCQNIDGVERQLALFAPPIDPALLVKASANGIAIPDALNNLLSPLPQYRFHYIVSKASELAQEVKSLGASLLAALEKKDAEQIALLRSTHELRMLEATQELRAMQLKEADEQIKILKEQKKMISFRKQFYDDLVANGLNEHESLQLESLQKSIPLKISQGVTQTLASTMSLIPNFKIGGPFTIGTTYGGNNIHGAMNAIAGSIGIQATVNDIIGSMAATKGSFKRREDDWKLQSKLAARELNQIERQLIASEIRKSISQTELQNHELQMRNTTEMDKLMHSKFTNEELYSWMTSEIALTYFQTYNLAIDVARQAERCYGFELGINSSNFITFGYWNSLKKGLLAGDQLHYDIKRMDVSFMEQHKRQHEMTKHISLANLAPKSLMELKNDGSTSIEIPEWIFDMDYPGHYFRRIKSVSVSIPCVAGPYTTVGCKLTMNSSKYRKQASVVSGGYNHEDNFNVVYGGGQSIATSHGQNDSGMFEFNFRDERYLPFEGAGAISNWTIELPAQYAQFDYDTITDVIIHINYTARYDGGLETAANTNLTSQIVESGNGIDTVLPRIFSLKQEFANEWNKYLSDVKAWNDIPANQAAFPKLEIPLNHEMFPFFVENKTIKVEQAVFDLCTKDNTSLVDLDIKEDGILAVTTLEADGSPVSVSSFVLSIAAGTTSTLEFELFKQGTSDGLELTDLDEIRDIQFALIYKLA